MAFDVLMFANDSDISFLSYFIVTEEIVDPRI